MGVPDELGDAADHPQRKVTLSPFLIDRFEVTRAQFARFLNEAEHGLGCEDFDVKLCSAEGRMDPVDEWVLKMYQHGEPFDLLHDEYNVYTVAGIHYEAHAGQATMAMVEVSPKLADAYCAWVGKVLPTHAQWEYAARFDPVKQVTRVYPWGDTFRRDVACSTSECKWTKRDIRVGDAAKGADYFTMNVDAYPADTSATGVRQLGGNVQEWVRECATPQIPECGACIDPIGATECAAGSRLGTYHWVADEGGRAARGGHLTTDSSNLFSANRERRGGALADLIGFRCALDTVVPIRVSAATSHAALP